MRQGVFEFPEFDIEEERKRASAAMFLGKQLIRPVPKEEVPMVISHESEHIYNGSETIVAFERAADKYNFPIAGSVPFVSVQRMPLRLF